MFDTHCHLNISPLFENHLELIRNARQKGVNFLVVPGMDIDDSKTAIDLSNDFENVYSSIGIHPTEDLEKLNIKDIEDLFDDLIEKHKNIVAIGESGLDYYKFKSPSSLQIKFYELHIKLASKHGLGLILHNRMATKDMIKVLKKSWSPSFSSKVVFHCCPPDDELLKFAKENNIFIGVDGDITYDSKKESFIKKVPLDLLVLETDSPNLTPLPVRNEKRFPNTPSNLRFIAKKVSEVKNVSVEEIIKVTNSNAKRLFDIL